MQVLQEREGTCHRTCYSLQLDGRALDHYSEIRSVPGLENESTLKVVEGQFTFQLFLFKLNIFIFELIKYKFQSRTLSARRACTCATCAT